MGMPYLVVDIDGTIANCKERADKYLSQTPKDWTSFFDACDEDKPIQQIITLVEELSMHYDVVFCSGRCERVREKTLKWMADNMITINGEFDLILRNDDDFRPDTEVKPEILDAFLKKHPNREVAYIIEDRNCMVAKWRELGYTVLQVADGDF